MKRSVLMAIGLLAGCTDHQADELVASRADEISIAPATRAAPYGVARTAARAASNRTVIGESGRRTPSHWPLRLALPSARAAQPGGGADIVGGSPHTGNPEVPIILMLDEAQDVIAICSGTLIAPKLVLTAAHCVDGVVPAVGYGVYFGTDALAEVDPGELFFTMAESVVFHPDWDPDVLDAGNDIGLIHLVDEVPITPAAIRTTPLADGDIGSPVHLVGWGITGGGLDDSGIKRHVISTLDDFNFNLVVVGNPETNTCSGDSGGPAFLEVGGVEQVVGVTSFGDENCEIQGVSTRVDAFVDFIDANSEPGGPGPGGGGGFGDPCSDASQCDSGVCVTGAGAAEGFCSELCDAANGCPGGAECVAVDAEDSVCVPAEQPGGGDGQLGDACSEGSQCASGLCATDDSGSGICTEECAGLLDCADGFSCEAVEGGSVCLPADDVSGGFPTPIATDEGGCSAAGGSNGPAALLLVLLALVLARVAQRRSPARPPRSLPE